MAAGLADQLSFERLVSREGGEAVRLDFPMLRPAASSFHGGKPLIFAQNLRNSISFREAFVSCVSASCVIVEPSVVIA
jgi:hypothetical protein